MELALELRRTTLKKKLRSVAVVAVIFTLVCAANAMAAEEEVNTPITANQAFDAVVEQVDPATGENTRVALIDVRTAAEYYWVGACGKVESITTTSGTDYTPHNGKVVLKWGNFLCFKVQDQYGLRPVFLPASKVESVKSKAISTHIPTHIWDEGRAVKYPNPDFAVTIEALSADYDVLILMCRSGKRSNTRAFDTSLFDAVYEIDDPNGKDGRGGFQGTSYGDAYNGYRGYPARSTKSQDTPSASWSDAGLPVHIGWDPDPCGPTSDSP
jgi:rhodanese-related sulfurtransferase